jgi:hypothetical protein
MKKRQDEKFPSQGPGTAMDHMDKIKRAAGKEANYPGTHENAAGKDGKEKMKNTGKIGTTPLPDHAINKGDQE